MTAQLLWGPNRDPVGPFYLNRDQGISGDKLPELNDRVDGQLWERVAERSVEHEDDIEFWSGDKLTRSPRYIPGPAEIAHEHVPGFECPNCGHLALRQFWVDSSKPWPADDTAHRALARQ